MRGLGIVFRPLSAFAWLVLLPCGLQSQTKMEHSNSSLPAIDRLQRQPAAGRPGFSLGDIPLQFEENQGQADARALFLARGRGYTLLLNSDGLALNLAPGGKHESSKSVSMHLLDAQPSRPIGRDQSITRTNYYIGKSPSDWHLNVPSYRSVMYPNLYKGIDLVYHGNGNQLEYDFVISPGADPDQVRMRFDGLKPTLRESELAFEGETGFAVGGLKAFQVIRGEKKGVEASWQLQGDRASIHLGPYDHQQQLVIDPVFFYGAYIGGSADDAAVSIVPSGQPGYFYVALSTDSAEITEPSQIPGNPNCGESCPTDTLILGINATDSTGPPSPFPPYSHATAPVPSLTVGSATYIGGNTGNTSPTAMVADSSTNLYIVGNTTDGANFPQLGSQTCAASCTGFITKLATSLNVSTGADTLTLKYSFGLPTVPKAVAVDPQGDAYITGNASTTAGGNKLTVPAKDAAFQNLAALGSALTTGTHAFLLELGPAGATLFASYIGGSGTDQGNAIALLGNNVFVAGQTSSSDFPASGNGNSTYGGGQDAFVFTALNLATAPTIVYSTYLGGSGTDSASAIAVVSSTGNVVVAGSSNSSDFPTQASPTFYAQSWALGSQSDGNGGNFATAPSNAPVLVNLPTAIPQGTQDAFVTSLSATGNLIFTDFLGGVDATSTSALALAVDNIGAIYVTGTSTATGSSDSDTPIYNFLEGNVTEDLAENPSYVGISNVFFSQIDPSGKYLLQATLAGGSGTDQGNGLSISGPLASAGVASIVGSTVSAPSSEFENPDLFSAASVSQVNPVNPPGPAKNDFTNATGFFVQEALAGYCDMQLTQQAGTKLTFSGPCVSGTQSGTLFATGTASNPSSAPPVLTAPITVAPSGNTLVGTATLDTSKLTGNQSLTVSFGFLPVGSVGGVGICQITGTENDPGTGVSGCGLITSGGGGGTLFDVSAGTLMVALTCTPPNTCVPVGGNSPNTYDVVSNAIVTLRATVTNGLPITVTWGAVNTPQGTLIPPGAPSVAATFTAGTTGGKTTITATSFADGTTKGTLTLLTLETPALTLTANTGPISYGQTVMVKVAATGNSSTPSGPFTYMLDGQDSVSGTLSSGGVATISLTGLDAGNHDITVTYPGNSQAGGFFTTAMKTLSFTVAPATLTVQATNASVDFGQDIPALTYTITGFQYQDSQATIGGAPSETTTATKGSPVGQYPITITKGTLGTNSSIQNYSLVFQNGTLSITTLGATPQPVIGLPSGTYTTAQQVTITDSLTGATIYFTTDGSAPTTGSTVYAGPIAVNKSETVQAVAIAAGHTLSAVTIAVFVLAAPSLSTTSLAFGNVVEGNTAAAQTVTLTNQGKNTLAGIAIAIAGTNATDFAIQSGATCAGSLQAGASCVASITFAPTGIGTRSAILSFSYTGIGTPQPVTLGGTGLGPLSIVTPPSQLVAGTTYQFTANEPAIWTASAGTITSSGLFTAPNPPPDPATVTITATSASNPQVSATTQVTIVPAPVVTVPTGITLGTGSTVSVPLTINAGTGIPGELLLLACTPASLPTGVTCSFTPNPVTVVSGGTSVTLNLASNPINTAAVPKPQGPWSRFPSGGSVMLAACCLLFGSRRFRQGRMLVLLICLLTSIGIMSLTACGTNGSFKTQTQQGFATGTYEIKVTVTGASPGSPDYNQIVTIFSVTVAVQ